jgi:hypothetical protein
MMDTAALADRVRQAALDRGQRLGEAFVNAAQNNAPRRTGAGADSIVIDGVSESAHGVVVRIVVGEIYMRYQNEGTGIYGPEGTPIVPHGHVLVFDWFAAGGVVFATHVRGTEPTHWWDRTIAQWPDIVGAS